MAPDPRPELKLFKIGGKVIDKPEALAEFLEGFAALQGPKILVHGGGVIAEQLAAQLDIPSEMRDGRRVTSRKMRDLVTMVYGGGINKSLVAGLQRLGCDAIGLTGADGAIVRSQRRSPEPIDFGYVGDVREVRSDLLKSLLDLGLTPVIAPLSFDEEILNTNADSIAGAIASAMANAFDVRMLYAFEAPGVMLDLKDPKSLIEALPKAEYRRLLDAKIFTDGMLPKLEECFRSIEKGVTDIVLADASNCLKAASRHAFRGTRLTP